MSVVPQNLVNYIVDRMQEGYQVDQIRTALLHYGYDPTSVDTAVNYVYKRKALGQEKFSVSPKLLLTISASMIVLVLGIFFFVSNQGEALLDVEINVVAPEVYEGTRVQAVTEIFNMGSTDVVDVMLEYTFVHESGDTVFEKRETIAVQTRASKSITIPLPTNAPLGRYTIFVVAYYADLIADAKTSVYVISRPDRIPQTQPEEQPTKQSTLNKEPKQTDTEVIPRQTTSLPTQQEPKKEPRKEQEKTPPVPTITMPKERLFQDVTKQIQALARTSPTKAQAVCQALSEELERNRCYQELGRVLLRPNICKAITDKNKRNSCLWNIVVGSGNIDCEEFDNKQLKTSCKSYLSLSEIK